MKERIRTIATADFYLSHLLFSLRTQDAAEQICRAWVELDDIKKVIAPQITHLSTLASVLGVDRRKAYLKRKKRSKRSTNPAEGDTPLTESTVILARSGQHIGDGPIEKVDRPQVRSRPDHELPGDPHDE